MSDNDLKRLAEEAAKADGEVPINMDTPAMPADEEPTSEEPTFIIGAPAPAPESSQDDSDDEDNGPTPVPVPLEGVDLGAPVASASVTQPSEKDKYIMNFNKTRGDRMKELLMNGLTPEEATAALDAQFNKGLESIEAGTSLQTSTATPTESADEAEAKPEAEIIIDRSKGQSIDDLKLTHEEHEKLQKVRSIRLIAVEDQDLKTIEIEAVDPDHKADFIHSIEGTLSHYAVPMPIMGDFIPFKGAQIVQLMNIVAYEDERAEDLINKQASLIYEKMMNGTITKKFDEKNKIVMSYTEFLNRFPYQDLDMAIYGILCASTMEDTTAQVTCNKCNHTWDAPYNVKTLLQTEGMSDYIKQRFDDVLANKGRPDVLTGMFEHYRKAVRYKSPFTNNIYDMNAPSIGRAINVLGRINQNDSVMVYNSVMALYMNRMLVFNKKTGKYLQVDENEGDLMLDSILALPDEDVQMLMAQIRDNMMYTPQFAIKVTCPSCHTEHTLPITISNLVFLRARDSYMEIQ